MKQILLEQILDNVVEAIAEYLDSIFIFSKEPPDNLENAPFPAQLFKEVNAMKSRLRASDANCLWLDSRHLSSMVQW